MFSHSIFIELLHFHNLDSSSSLRRDSSCCCCCFIVFNRCGSNKLRIECLVENGFDLGLEDLGKIRVQLSFAEVGVESLVSVICAAGIIGWLGFDEDLFALVDPSVAKLPRIISDNHSPPHSLPLFLPPSSQPSPAPGSSPEIRVKPSGFEFEVFEERLLERISTRFVQIVSMWRRVELKRLIEFTNDDWDDSRIECAAVLCFVKEGIEVELEFWERLVWVPLKCGRSVRYRGIGVKIVEIAAIVGLLYGLLRRRSWVHSLANAKEKLLLEAAGLSELKLLTFPCA
ncbi:hypothetical protein Drorol1_Dr00007952 [Drosera rotundifolia]